MVCKSFKVQIVIRQGNAWLLMNQESELNVDNADPAQAVQTGCMLRRRSNQP